MVKFKKLDLRSKWKATKGKLAPDTVKRFKSDLGPNLDKFEKTCEKLAAALDQVTTGSDKAYKTASSLVDEMTKLVVKIQAVMVEYRKVLDRDEVDPMQQDRGKKSLDEIKKAVDETKSTLAKAYASARQGIK